RAHEETGGAAEVERAARERGEGRRARRGQRRPAGYLDEGRAGQGERAGRGVEHGAGEGRRRSGPGDDEELVAGRVADIDAGTREAEQRAGPRAREPRASRDVEEIVGGGQGPAGAGERGPAQAEPAVRGGDQDAVAGRHRAAAEIEQWSAA